MILTSRRQQRALAAMQASLRGSDPRLVARFALFTELAGDKAMPAAERVRHRPLRRMASAFHGLAYRWRRASQRRRPAREAKRERARWRLGGVVFIPAAAVAMLVVVMLLHQGQGRCTQARTAGASRAAVARMFNSVRGGTTPQQQDPSCSGR